MKSVFSSGDIQREVTHEIQKPIKELTLKWVDGKFRLRDALELMKLLKSLMSLPKATKENIDDPNLHILLDIKEDFFKHLNMPQFYVKIYEAGINYAIGKLAFDNLYKAFLNWWLGEMFRRGYQLPGQNRPSSNLWHNITPSIRQRLSESIKTSYDIYQDRIRKIEKDWQDPEFIKQQKEIRYGQFINRILDAVELEVESWK